MNARKMSERERKAWTRHHEVGHPEGYDGPCWGPTAADYEYVDDLLGALERSLTPRVESPQETP